VWDFGFDVAFAVWLRSFEAARLCSLFSQQKTQPFRLGYRGGWAHLGHFYHAIGLRAFLALHNFELYLIAFLQALVAFRLYGAVMDENIGTVLLANESESFCIVKPLNCAFNACHLHTFPIFLY
jgi:hypothetical protein